jgi:hypothetical protein
MVLPSPQTKRSVPAGVYFYTLETGDERMAIPQSRGRKT